MHIPEQASPQRKTILLVVLLGAAVNLALAAAKTTVGIAFQSQSLFADGVHSISDLATDIVVLVGARLWTAPADADHPYGHGRVETLVNVFIALVLAATGVGIAWEGIQTVGSGESIPLGWPAFVVALASLVSKEALFRWTVRKGWESGSSAVIANAWHHRSDALSSIPVVLAVVVGWIAPELTFLDPVAAVLVAALLIKAAWDIVKPAGYELLETGNPRLAQDIHDIAETRADVLAVYDVRTRRVGSAVFVDMKMVVPADLTVAALHSLTHEVEADIRRRHPAVVELQAHAEPGIDASTR